MGRVVVCLTAWEIKDRQAAQHLPGLLGQPCGLTAWEIKDRQAESARQAVVAAPPSHSLGNQRPSGGDRHYKFPPPAFRLTAWEIKRPSGG